MGKGEGGKGGGGGRRGRASSAAVTVWERGDESSSSEQGTQWMKQVWVFSKRIKGVDKDEKGRGKGKGKRQQLCCGDSGVDESSISKDDTTEQSVSSFVGCSVRLQRG